MGRRGGRRAGYPFGNSPPTAASPHATAYHQVASPRTVKKPTQSVTV